MVVMFIQSSLLSLQSTRISFIDQVDEFEMESPEVNIQQLLLSQQLASMLRGARLMRRFLKFSETSSKASD